jgi:hypothetical protein
MVDSGHAVGLHLSSKNGKMGNEWLKNDERALT